MFVFILTLVFIRDRCESRLPVCVFNILFKIAFIRICHIQYLAQSNQVVNAVS